MISAFWIHWLPAIYTRYLDRWAIFNYIRQILVKNYFDRKSMCFGLGWLVVPKWRSQNGSSGRSIPSQDPSADGVCKGGRRPGRLRWVQLHTKRRCQFRACREITFYRWLRLVVVVVVVSQAVGIPAVSCRDAWRRSVCPGHIHWMGLRFAALLPGVHYLNCAT